MDGPDLEENCSSSGFRWRTWKTSLSSQKAAKGAQLLHTKVAIKVDWRLESNSHHGRSVQRLIWTANKNGKLITGIKRNPANPLKRENTHRERERTTGGSPSTRTVMLLSFYWSGSFIEPLNGPGQWVGKIRIISSGHVLIIIQNIPHNHWKSFLLKPNFHNEQFECSLQLQ